MHSAFHGSGGILALRPGPCHSSHPQAVYLTSLCLSFLFCKVLKMILLLPAAQGGLRVQSDCPSDTQNSTWPMKAVSVTPSLSQLNKGWGCLFCRLPRAGYIVHAQ